MNAGNEEQTTESWTVEVFRRLYSAVGFGPLVAVTKLPLVSHGMDWAYHLFAKNRLKMTGRCNGDTCQTTT